MTKYLNVLAAFYGSRWAIVESWHSNLEAILRERASGVELSAEEIQTRIDARDYRTSEPAEPQNATAVIRLYGPIVPRANLMTEYSGGATHSGFARSVREAADDDSVSEIVLDISSPGGTVEGIDVSAESVRYAADKKPVTAVTEGMMCSAAYWIASQADKIVASPTAQIGSIGVLAGHTDMTKLEENLGLKTTIFRSGPKKALGHPSETLSDTAQKEIQREVDELYDVFLRDVAAGRGRTKKQVKDEWGDGAVYATARALELGLVDEQGTLYDVLNGSTPTSSPKRKRGGRKASAMEENMTLEELKAENPTLYDALMAQARTDVATIARAEGHAAGLAEGRTQAQNTASGDDPTVVRLEQTVTQLSGKLEASERRAENDRRTAIAVNAYEAANFNEREWPKVEGSDVNLEANFRRRLNEAVIGADSDDEARTVADSLCAEQIAFLPFKDRKTSVPKRELRPLVPSGDNTRKAEGNKPKADGMAAIRREQGLYS